MFHVLLLKQDTTKKGWINIFAEVSKFDKSNDKEYEMKAIRNNTIYATKADGYLPGLYYLVPWKSYSEEENT